ncbi:hypothetical protein TGAM01_v209249 [Trichoderma gamsii]|uniref:Uncharacterized protein n=1 Tax=Trichoderma gamsii TaxID=398673 RepID=A0A2P4ZBZ8_9HYPO|nr:hypothetical protein TGAM01_v209249 [Trichoderma gamsii]PON21819.1 hypothetical protein TGAM01_v209249 [Trichoderma gamsii]
MAPAEIVPKDYLGLINDKTEREWTPPTPVMENTEEQEVKDYQKRLTVAKAEKAKTKNTSDTNPATAR